MRDRLGRQVQYALPAPARVALGLTHAAATILGALVVVTSLVPVLAVCLAALGARPAAGGRLSRSSRPARESA
jgi:hypothetical protein